ncbi:MAG: sugar O-acetyltransferase [Sulfitobacter sp.]
MTSQRQQMEAGVWYSCLDEDLNALRQIARRAVHAHNHLIPDERRTLSTPLRGLFAASGDSCLIEAPFHCSYGVNIHLGNRIYMNAGVVILDSARVQIGDGTLIGPRAQIICAEHHKDPAERRKGMEIALPVTIGKDVWIGAGALIMPGVVVGDGAIVGAGAVVTRDVPVGATVVGIPARAL